MSNIADEIPEIPLKMSLDTEEAKQFAKFEWCDHTPNHKIGGKPDWINGDQENPSCQDCKIPADLPGSDRLYRRQLQFCRRRDALSLHVPGMRRNEGGDGLQLSCLLFRSPIYPRLTRPKRQQGPACRQSSTKRHSHAPPQLRMPQRNHDAELEEKVRHRSQQDRLPRRRR